MSIHTTALVATMMLYPFVLSSPASAQDTAASAGEACGKTLSETTIAAWRGVDGREGRLGCPVESEGDTATSVKGTAARGARFEGGEIIRHMSGPLAGRAYAVAACDRLYVQYGGASGWLGLPTTDAINNPDGQRQSFEGGTLRLLRATGECEAERG